MTFKHQSSTGPVSLAPLTGKICKNRTVMIYEADLVSKFLPEGWTIVGSTGGPRSNVTALAGVRRDERTHLSLEINAGGLRVDRMVAQLEERHVGKILGSKASLLYLEGHLRP